MAATYYRRRTQVVSRRRLILILFLALVSCTFYYKLTNWFTKNRRLPPEIRFNACRNHGIDFGNVLTTTGSERQQDFQMVSSPESPEKIFFYSAYFDEETSAVIVIGGMREKTDTRLYCTFFDERGLAYSTQLGTVYHFEVNRDSQPYTRGTMAMCALLPPACKAPSFVSLSSGTDLAHPLPDSTPNLAPPLPDSVPDLAPPILDSAPDSDQPRPPQPNLFPIGYNTALTDAHYISEPIKFAICVQPTFNFDDPFHFLEWLEFHTLMGVQKFTFYNESIGPRTSCVMRALEAEGQGLVEVLPWSPVFVPEVEIHVHSQIIQTMDCLHRFRGRAKFVIGLDFDEFIVPSRAANFSELIQELGLDLSSVSALVFRNSMFYLNESGSGLPGGKIEKSMRLSSSKFRKKTMSPPYDRSKYFGQPTLISEPGVHYVYKSIGNAEMFSVPPEVAYLHHYRLHLPSRQDCENLEPEFYNEDCDEDEKVADLSAHRFVSDVAERVRKRIQQFGDECNIARSS